MKRGLFIVFEGGEGAGKSTQTELLVRQLRATDHQVVVTREPGGTRIVITSLGGRYIFLDAVTEAYLMAASRAQHVRETIAPALHEGNIVVCDRYVDSSIAYQGYGRALGEAVIADLNVLAVDDAQPDMVLLLNLPTEVGHERVEKEGKRKDRLDLQEKDFYERVNNGYLTLAKTNPNRYVVVDATKSIEEVASVIWKIVEDALARRDEKKST
ncbi:MAG: thymidylate kinase [Candidatus Gottesmanbacteria bacterium GW2011_GWB1_49_7]|uniref:Thymidylate kinase n=1 Tax=Candidatus Gottesmanbacteria bacterium GW2011_GWB1_49_7 TaxID=1618448 RepID=A0A0G1VYY7_9BACT|nr:MAG: thymidylate kinase [Candidatus Gottesmanbacteria bacterium GW2011_GWB1_49_7]